MKNSIASDDTFISYLKELPNYMTIFIVTIFFATASPMLIEMSRTTGYSIGDLSLIFTFFTVGIVTGQLTSVFFNRKFRKITIILFGYFLIISLLISMANITNLYLFYTLYLLTGYTSGVLWIQATKYILENKIKNKDRLTNIFLIFNSLGYIAAPFISSKFIENGIAWEYSYYLLAGLSVIILILYIILKHDWREKILTFDDERISIRKIFHNRRLNIVFIFGCLLLFFYCISESATIVWSPTYLRSEKLFDLQTASLAVSVFWIMVLVGRIIISFLAGHIKTNLMILALSTLAVIAMVIFFPLKTTYTTLIAIGFAGLGCSAIVPLGISSASTIYEKGRGVLASLLFAMASMGTSVAPLIIRSFSRINTTLSMIIAPLAMGLTVLTVIGKIIYEKRSKEQ